MKKNGYNLAESVKLIYSGDDFFQVLEEIIDGARETIHLQTYIFEADTTGSKIANCLINAAKRKVEIYVLLDAYGSKALSREFVKTLKDAGINFRFFSPIFSSENIYLGRRLHHKVVVIDGSVALVGGINIADKYHGTIKEAAWLDYAILVKGDMCVNLQNTCKQIYDKRNYIAKKERAVKRIKFNGKVLVRFTRNDWIRGKDQIYRSYIKAIENSKKSVIIIASYFLPGYRFKRAIKMAKKRGVDVKIILAGKSDLPFLWYAEKYLYYFLLQSGIEIYEWPNSVLHGKAIIVDDDWATIGSYNLNQLSHYRSIELNVEINNKGFSDSFRKHVKNIIENDCKKITGEYISFPAGLLSGIRNSISYYLLRFIMKILILKRQQFY